MCIFFEDESQKREGVGLPSQRVNERMTTKNEKSRQRGANRFPEAFDTRINSKTLTLNPFGRFEIINPSEYTYQPIEIL